MLRWFRLSWLFSAAVSIVFGATATARADLIFLKDGTILQGKLIRESVVDFDPATHEPIRMPVGFYLIDDGARRLYFCQSQVAKVVTQEEGQSDVRIPYQKGFVVSARGVPPIHQVVEAEPWDDQWNRKIRLLSQANGGSSRVTVRQHLAMLTPQYAKADAITMYSWAQYYATRELGPQIVEELLSKNPQSADDPKLKESERISRRFRNCDFYAQAGWYDSAERDLTKLAADFPGQKAQVDAAREALRKVRTREQFELIKRLHLAGQYKTVKAALEAFAEKDATAVVAADFRSFKAAFDEAAEKYADTLRMLDVVATNLKDAPEGMAVALAAVQSEMHPERVHRLEAFLGQALQAERQMKANRTPELSPGGLAALAVTGWLLGGPSADPKPETALRLWRSRELVLKYLRSNDAGTREKILANYAKQKTEYAGLDEICQLIPQLPPEAPEPDTKGVEVELKAGDSRNDPLYLVKVPPEYSHNRLYPMLMALPPSGEPAVFTIRRLEGLCAENGYILVVPRWEDKAKGGYRFSEREHQVVLDVLRDARRRFQVDSDRVYLTGAGFGGGDMAFDVGMSHPDLFAAVVPMGAGPSYFSESYWRNAQYLPFYVINGDRSGEGNKKTREQFNCWIPRGFNSMWVQYKGRGVEWFGGELAAAFDWMRNKRRAFPMRQLGSFGTEFYTMRQCDNHFYWLSTEEVAPSCCNNAENWNNRVISAKMTGRVDPGTNEIYLQASGVKQVYIWLGRNDKGETMIDFDKPVGVYLGLKRFGNRNVTPSLEVLLKDLAERGDRQQLFLARLVVKL
jgi:hypothetical protein